MSTVVTLRQSYSASPRIELGNAIERSMLSGQSLATGKGILHAWQDPTGLAIGSNMQATANTLGVVLTGVIQSQQLLEVAQTSMEQLLNRCNDLTTMLARAKSGLVTNDTIVNTLSTAFSLTKQEMVRIAEDTEFNGVKLLNGTGGKKTEGVKSSIQDATYSFNQASLTTGSMSFSGPGGSTKNMSPAGIGAVMSINPSSILISDGAFKVATTTQIATEADETAKAADTAKTAADTAKTDADGKKTTADNDKGTAKTAADTADADVITKKGLADAADAAAAADPTDQTKQNAKTAADTALQDAKTDAARKHATLIEKTAAADAADVVAAAADAAATAAAANKTAADNAKTDADAAKTADPNAIAGALLTGATITLPNAVVTDDKGQNCKVNITIHNIDLYITGTLTTDGIDVKSISETSISSPTIYKTITDSTGGITEFTDGTAFSIGILSSSEGTINHVNTYHPLSGGKVATSTFNFVTGSDLINSQIEVVLPNMRLDSHTYDGSASPIEGLISALNIGNNILSQVPDNIIDLNSKVDANNNIPLIDALRNQIITQLDNIGAQQQRFRNVVDQLSVYTESMDTAQGVFLNADLAKTTEALGKDMASINVITSALQSMFGISNSIAKLVTG